MPLNPSQFIKQHHHGVLSTHSVSHSGYPFGSVVPYIISPEGFIAIYISELAEHSKNINADNKVALTISDNNQADSPANAARITCLAKATPSHEQHILNLLYQQQVDDADMILELPGFQFYQLNLTAVRLIGGFGNISWLSPFELDLR